MQLRLQLLDLVTAGLIPGDHDIQQVAIDGEIADLIDRAHRRPARIVRIKRVLRFGCTAAQHRNVCLLYTSRCV